jgi:hypothetical protein
VCDVVYTLIVDDLRMRVLADRGVAATFKAFGGADIELPDPDAERARFDEWLVSPLVTLTPVDRERLELLRALGLRM